MFVAERGEMKTETRSKLFPELLHPFGPVRFIRMLVTDMAEGYP